MSTFFSLVSTRPLRNAPHSRFRCGSLNQCLLMFIEMVHLALRQVYRFGQCLGERFSPLSTFFSLVSSREFRDAPQSSFRCGNPY